MKKRGIVFMGIAVITVFLNILAWNSTAFSDWYIAHIFPLWVNTYAVSYTHLRAHETHN